MGQRPKCFSLPKYSLGIVGGIGHRSAVKVGGACGLDHDNCRRKRIRSERENGSDYWSKLRRD